MKRFPYPYLRRLVCLLVAISSLGMGVLYAEPATESAEQSPAGDRLVGIAQMEEQTREKLQALTSLEFIETPILDVFELIRERHGVTVHLMPELQAQEKAAAHNSKLAVTCSLHKISLEALLKHLLRPLGLQFKVKEGVVLVGTPDMFEDELQVRVFPVRDLIEYKDSRGEISEDVDTLIELITGTVQPNMWDSVGGPARVGEFNGQLVIRQTPECLNEIEQLLTALRKLPSLEHLGEKPVPLVIYAGDGDNPREKKIRAALAARTRLDFTDQPLSDIVAYITDLAKIHVLLDEKGLKEVGLDKKQPCTLQVDNISLRSALERLLRPLELSYCIQDEVLVITAPDVAREVMITKLYAMQDLIDLSEKTNAWVTGELDMVIYVLQSAVQPNDWDSVGGPNHLDDYSQRGALVVSCSADVHEEIEAVLIKMIETKRAQATVKKPEPLSPDEFEWVVYQLHYVSPQINKKSGLPETPAPVHLDTEKLAELIPLMVGARLWGANDNKEVIVRALADRLVVRHQRKVQKKVEEAVRQLGVYVQTLRAGEEGLGPQMMGGGFSGSGIFNIPEQQGETPRK